MNRIFLIKDKTDANFRKPFVGVYKSEEKASQRVAQLKARLSKQAQSLVSYESVEVSDFDPNKNHVYVIFDKTKGYNMKFSFDFNKTSQTILDMKRKLSPQNQRLVSMQMIEVF